MISSIFTVAMSMWALRASKPRFIRNVICVKARASIRDAAHAVGRIETYGGLCKLLGCQMCYATRTKKSSNSGVLRNKRHDIR